MRIKAIVLILAFVTCNLTLTDAQEITGTILGTVTDSTGAVLKEATVTVTNADRDAVIRTVMTNALGQYVAPLLPIGHYTVKVEASGFKAFTKTGIELNVNDRLQINAQLPAGAISESVTVEADALQVETQSATAQGLINGTQIRELALSARNYEEMVALTPGTSSNITDTIYVGVETPNGGTNQVSFSINGLRFSQNNWTIDGGDNVDRGGNFSLLNYPSVDAIAEFKVLRSLYNPEYGRGAGGEISVITRSGTSRLHGGAYEFFRNNVLNANTWVNKSTSPMVPRTPLRYNDFGWTFGGPIYIPGHYNSDKNKTFFFYSEELRRIVTYGSVLATVPNAQERQGVFAQPVCTSYDASGNCLNPVMVIPQTSFNPAAQAYLQDVFSHLPLPQDPVSDTLALAARNQFNFRQELIRVDHTFSPKLAIMGRWINDTIPTINPAGLFGQSNVLGYATTDTNSPGHNLLFRGTLSLRPTLLNEIGYAWSYGAITSTPVGLSSFANAPNVVKAITLPFPTQDSRIPNITWNNALPTSSLLGFGPYGDFNRNHNVFDNLTWVKGRHTFKFGGSYHRYQKSENDAGGISFPNGDFQFFGTDPTGVATFQQEWASFLLGNVSSFQQNSRDFRAEIRQHMLEIYAQDEFRLKPNLTISYGVRYTHYGQPTDANNQNTSFDPAFYKAAQGPTMNADGSLCVTGAACDTGLSPNPNYNPLNGVIVSSNNKKAVGLGATPSPFGPAVADQDSRDFAPRIGFAWDPFRKGKTSVRGGYGIFYDSPAVGFVENNLFVNPPFANNILITNTIFNNPGAVSPSVNNSSQFVRGVSPTWRLPYTQSWSLDVQYELGRGFVVDVGYYGDKGTHLLGIIDINQPVAGAYVAAGLAGPGGINSTTFPVLNLIRPYKGYGPINEFETIFNSNYHSLQASVQKRIGANSLIAANYTWSHALTDAGNDFSSPQDNRNLRAEYGPADFDRRHIFNINFVYEFPWLKSQPGFVGHLLGGWEFSGIVTYNSGLFLTPNGSANSIDPAGLGFNDPHVNSGDQLTFASAQRPDQVGDPNSGICSNGQPVHTALCWFNDTAFQDVPLNQVRPGNVRRGTIKGPGIERWDMSLFKNIKATERVNFQFRAEGFNIFNHTNFQTLDHNMSSGTFGQVTDAHQPRILQLGLKMNF